MNIVMRHLGLVLILFSVTTLIPFLTALYLGESFLPFLITLLVSASLGVVLRILSGGIDKKARLTIQRAVSLTALSFIILPIIGSIPSMMILKMGVLTSLFESYSGFTTTGLTLLTSLSEVPKSLILWRAQSQWTGGLGIVLFALLVILMLRARTPELSTRARSMVTLYRAQGSSQIVEPSLRKSIKKTILIYIFYTSLGALFLFFTGIRVFESICLALTSVSTGGFTPTQTLILGPWSMVVLCVLMIVGATSFSLHNRIFKLDFKSLTKSFELKVFVAITAIAAVSVSFISRDIQSGVFHTISTITTTGYALSDLTMMPYLAVMIIVLCMVIGGSLGSTSGGIKMLRLGLILKSIPWMIKKVSYPSRAVIPLKMEGKSVDESTLVMVQVFTFVYVLFLIFGTITLMVCGNSFMDSSFHMASALGTVGVQTPALLGMNAICKVVLIIAMILGRLEVFPVLVLFWSIAEGIRHRPSEVNKEKTPIYSRILPTELWRR